MDALGRGWQSCCLARERCAARGPCCRQTLCGVDVDDVFVYDVPKIARIRDAWLGVLYLLVLAGIAGYIFIFQLWRKNNYLAYRDPEATVRLTLQQPTVDNCDPSDLGCKDSFPPISELTYCCSPDCPPDPKGGCRCPWRTFRNFDCEYMDGHQASTIEDKSILITSFDKQYTESLNSSCGIRGCSKLWDLQGVPSQRFVAGIENFTMLIDHSVAQQDLGIYKTNREMQGYLLVNGTSNIQQKLCKDRDDALTEPTHGRKTNKAPCYIRPKLNTNDTLDIFALDTLLRAMGVTLDGPSYSGSGHSMRYEGLTAILQIEYFNTWPWLGVLNEVSYIYSLISLDTSPYKKTNIYWTHYPDKRVRQSAHGIYFSVTPAGRLAVFDFTTLLVTLTTSLALLAVGQTVVKYLALYVLRHRKYYTEMIFERSPDFSCVRDLERMDEDQITQILTQRGLGTAGTHHQRILRLLHVTEGSGVEVAERDDSPGMHFRRFGSM